MELKTYPRMRWTPEMVARFWDWQSRFPEVYFTHQFGREIVRSLGEYLHGRDSILDYGCGVGDLLEHLCGHGKQVCGADLSPESVDKVNARLEGTRGFSGAYRVDELVDAGRKFDAVIAVELIEHLYDDELDSTMAQIGDMLAPSGIVIFSTPNNEDLDTGMILCPATGEEFHRWQHVRSWNRETLSAYLQKSGYQIIGMVETNLANQMPTSLVKWVKWMMKQVVYNTSKKPHLLSIAAKL